jgi:nucleoside 2-deoxyribosyltransferase
MDRCFVIQPFDGGDFDARYDEVLAPAIKLAGLEPYRVDRDPHASIPIRQIEEGIRKCRISLADISLDRPNIWFELGFAIASQRPVVMICHDEQRSRYPFDVQHRSIIAYKTGTMGALQQLKDQVVARLQAELEKAVTIEAAAVDSASFEGTAGLADHEVVCMAALGESLRAVDDWASLYQMRQDIERAGYPAFAATLGVKALMVQGLVTEVKGFDDANDSFTGYQFTSRGWDWVLKNKDRFTRKANSRRVQSQPSSPGFDDDEIPF